MRFDIDTLVRVVKIYDWDSVNNCEVLIYDKQFEYPLDFWIQVKYMFSIDINNLKKDILDSNKNVKTFLKSFLRERGVAQEDLYSRTGFRFEDVRLYTEFEEIKRLLED